jgi:hypothetical protein
MVMDSVRSTLGPRGMDKLMFDGRNIFDPQDMKKLGYSYYCIGIDTKPKI